MYDVDFTDGHDDWDHKDNNSLSSRVVRAELKSPSSIHFQTGFLIGGRFYFGAIFIGLQEKALNPLAYGFTGVIAVHLPQLAEIAIHAFGQIVQRFRVNRRSAPFPCPDFLPAIIEGGLPQIGAAWIDNESGEINSLVGKIDMFFLWVQPQGQMRLQEIY